LTVDQVQRQSVALCSFMGGRSPMAPARRASIFSPFTLFVVAAAELGATRGQDAVEPGVRFAAPFVPREEKTSVSSALFVAFEVGDGA
jgi:hypothetical protein